MAQIPMLIPGLLTMIPAALWMTYLYRRRRRPRPDQIHLHSLRSSLQRKRERKRQRLGQENGLEESRSLLASVSAGSMRRLREDDTRHDSDYDSDDEEEEDDDEDDEDEDDEGENEAEEDVNDEGEHAVEIELDAVMADLNHQLRIEQMKAELGQDGADNNHDIHNNNNNNNYNSHSNDNGASASASTVIDLPPLPEPLRSFSRREPSHSKKKKSHPTPSATTSSYGGQPFPALSSSSPSSSSSSSSSAGRATHRSIYGILYLNLLEARLPPPPFPASSCFIICSHGTQVYRTASSKRSNQPVWNQKVRLVVREREVGWPVSISLWVRRGKRRGGGVYCIGRTLMDLREMMNDGSGGSSGSIELDKLHAANAERKRKRAKEQGEDGEQSLDFPVKNFWRELTGQSAPQSQQVASFYDTESVEPSQHASTSAANPLLPRSASQSAAATVITWLHMESLFLPLPSAAIGPQLWSDICSLYDVHDEGKVDAEHVQQLLECIGGMRDEDKADLAQRAKQSGGLTVEELSERLTRCETEREKEIKARRKQLKKTNGELDTSIATTEANTPASDPPSASSSSTSLSSFLIDVPLTPSHALLPQATDLTPVYLSKCPVCLLSLTPSSSLDPRDCLVHVRFCLETLHSIAPTNSSALSHSEFATGGFISEEYAVKNWASSMLQAEHYGSDKLLTYLSSRAHFILVQDRQTGQLRPEKVPFLVKLLFRFIYQSAIGRSAHSSLSFGLMARMSEMMGRKYDHESSRAHIAAFVSYYGIDMSEFEKPIDEYRTFNDFFYRRLKPGRRPIAGQDDESVIVSPADCRITVFQSVSEATRIWIKGKTFSLSSLLVDPQLVKQWPDCSLAIARLAPDDYHRFHLPLTCTIGESRIYSGGYASVNPLAIRSQKDVLTQNKRVLTLLHHTVVGDVLYIAVGATMVGSVVLTTHVGDRKVKGDEHGYFAFGGSTVLLLFRQGSVRFDDDLLYNTSKSMETLIRMGESIGRTSTNTASGSSSGTRHGHRLSGELVGVTKSTINPLSAKKLEENEAVLQEEKRERRASVQLVGEEEAEGEGEGEVEDVEGGELFTVGDLSVEEVREVRDVLLSAGDM